MKLSEDLTPSRDGGYVRIYRRVLEHKAFGSPLHAHIFIHMIMRAAWRDYRTRSRGEVIDLKRGQLVAGERSLAEDFGVSRKVIARLIEVMKESRMISLSRSHRFTVITICNYDSHQASAGDEGPLTAPVKEPQRSHRGATEEPPKKEENQGKEGNEGAKEGETPSSALAITDLAPAKDDIAESFEEWWRQYPPGHRKSDKKGCAKKYRRIVQGGEVTADDLLGALLAYSASDEVARGFESAPMAWLNKSRWEGWLGPPGPRQRENSSREYNIDDVFAEARRQLDMEHPVAASAFR